jgi:hypothetical protein
MVLHDFIYEWDGKNQDGEKPVSWWPGSYHVRIVKLAADNTNVSYLVPFAVILKNAKIKAEMNTSLKNYIYTFAKKISQKYNLDMGKTLWVEVDNSPQDNTSSNKPNATTEYEISVTRLQHRSANLFEATVYSVTWRPALPNEKEMLTPYLTDM